MCNCRKDIEAKLTKRFIDANPAALGHGVKLQGYGLVIVGDKLLNVPYMPYKATAEHPLKKGGTKVKSETGHMFFSYCPFCGEKEQTQ